MSDPPTGRLGLLQAAQASAKLFVGQATAMATSPSATYLIVSSSRAGVDLPVQASVFQIGCLGVSYPPASSSRCRVS